MTDSHTLPDPWSGPGRSWSTFLKDAWRLARPYFHSEERWRARLMLFVIVALNPQAEPRAFLTNGRQGINLHRGTWHGVLTPLQAPGLFAVVDRIGTTPNLEEHRYAAPYTVTE